MRVENKSSFMLIKPNEKSFKEFLKNFELNYNSFKASHIISDLTSLEPLKAVELNKLLKWSKKSKQLKKSFIIVVKQIDIDAVSDALVCTPTLLEAQDTFEMEEMERDLGF